MTLEEAILHAEEVADRCAVTDGNIQCENEHRQLAEWLKDYKRLLEQEPILDKIRDEISQLPSYVAKFEGGNCAIHIDKEKVLQIIDKYRGEVDCRECKAEHDCYECKKYTESEES